MTIELLLFNVHSERRKAISLVLKLLKLVWLVIWKGDEFQSIIPATWKQYASADLSCFSCWILLDLADMIKKDARNLGWREKQAINRNGEKTSDFTPVTEEPWHMHRFHTSDRRTLTHASISHQWQKNDDEDILMKMSIARNCYYQTILLNVALGLYFFILFSTYRVTIIRKSSLTNDFICRLRKIYQNKPVQLEKHHKGDTYPSQIQVKATWHISLLLARKEECANGKRNTDDTVNLSYHSYDHWNYTIIYASLTLVLWWF